MVRGPKQSVPQAEIKTVVHRLLEYSALIFVFPAAALINYAGTAIDSGSHTSATFSLFILFSFLIVEVSTTRYWLELEFLGPKVDIKKKSASKWAPNLDKRSRAFLIFALEVLRVFFLTSLYICFLKAYGASNSDTTSQLTRLSIFLLGFFLATNYGWNQLVTPEHDLAFEKFMKTLNHDRTSEAVQRLFNNLFIIEKILFWYAFPFCSVALIIFGIVGLYTSSMAFIIILFIFTIQGLAKMLQAWGLSVVTLPIEESNSIAGPQ